MEVELDTARQVIPRLSRRSGPRQSLGRGCQQSIRYARQLFSKVNPAPTSGLKTTTFCSLAWPWKSNSTRQILSLPPTLAERPNRPISELRFTLTDPTNPRGAVVPTGDVCGEGGRGVGAPAAAAGGGSIHTSPLHCPLPPILSHVTEDEPDWAN